MLDMKWEYIISQNNMHPAGTEKHIFEEFQIVKNELCA